MTEDTNHWVEALLLTVIAFISGGTLSGIHNMWHGMFGTGTASILGITMVLGLLSFAGYYVWTVLTEVEFNTTIGVLTYFGMAVPHYLSHGILPSFEMVGGVVFAVGMAGTVFNYTLRPDGVQL